MNNNRLLYIIENKEFSGVVEGGMFTGIDTESESFPYYMEGRVLKSQLLMQELKEGVIPYEYLEIVANSQLNELQSEALIEKIKEREISRDEIFEFIESCNVLELSNDEYNEGIKMKKESITKEDLAELREQTELKDTDIVIDIE